MRGSSRRELLTGTAVLGATVLAPGLTDLAKAVSKGCQKRHLLLLTCGPWNNTIRWIPPLTVTQEQMEEALAAFRDTLAEVL